MLTFIMRLLLQNKNIGAVQKYTNSGRRNLLNVKGHIKKIGFELVLKTVLSDIVRNSAGRLYYIERGHQWDG